jgi:hypothetical protein
MPESPKPVQLKPQTLEAYLAYIHDAEEGMQASLSGEVPFLWSAGNSEREKLVRKGNIPAQLWSGDRPVKISNGLVHDWIGAVRVPNSSVDDALALVQDYNNHKNIYKPEVMDSKLLSRHGNDFKIYLRLLKKKIVTVVLDTDHDVRYTRVHDTAWTCRSYTTRIAEVEDAATPKETILEPDTGYGFLWRLYSYWRFAEDADGVTIECRAISLTRDVPLGLGWIIEPIIKNLPRESLVNTLKATRNAIIGSRATR